MKNNILWLSALFGLMVCLPTQALDRERRAAIQAEVESRDLAQYLLIFENYANYGSLSDISAARSVVDSTNALTGKYQTVDKLHDFLHELVESGYFEKGAPLMVLNFRASLRVMQEKGFGSGKLGRWQYKQMLGECNQLENVYHTTVNHPVKTVAFGFVLSAGYGYVSAELLKGKVLDSSCP